MSLILDALNRSDSDRQEPGATPGLHSTHGSGERETDSTLKKVLWPALFLLLAAAAILPWVSRNERPAPAETIAANESGPVVVVAPKPEPVTTAPAAEVEAVEDTAALSADVAALYQSAEPASPEQAKAEPETPAPVPVSAPAETAEPALDVDALAQAAQQELAEVSSQPRTVVEHEAPFITDLSQRDKDAIPSIFFSAHAWASNPAERSVVLNGRTFHEGDQVKPGLKLVEILEDSIVLQFRGSEFRLRSLNSWVNL